MAAGGVSSTVQDLEEVTNCVVCLETYRDPRTLPCLHILCNQCIQGLIQKAKDENRSTINCPLCQKKITIQHPPEFPVSFLTNTLIDILVKRKSSKKAQCHSCSERNGNSAAQWLCTICGELLCPGCKVFHDRYQTNHVCLDLQNLDSKTLKKIKPRYCGKHKKEIEFLCVDCMELLCINCSITKHKDHTTHAVSDDDVVQTHKKRVQDFNKKAGKLLGEMEQHRTAKDKEVDETVVTIKARHQEMLQALNQHTDSLVKQAEKAREEYHEKPQNMEKLKATLENTKMMEQEGTNIDIVDCSIQTITQFDEMLAELPTNTVGDEDDNMLQVEFGRNVEEVKTVFGQLKFVGGKSSFGTSLGSTAKIISTIKLTTEELACGMATTKDGKVILAMFKSPNILTVNKDGTQFLITCEHLKQAYDINCHDGYIYISDHETGAIHVYSMNMKYCKTMAGVKDINSFPSFSIFGDNLYLCLFSDDGVLYTSLTDETIKHMVVKHPKMSCPWCVHTNGKTIVVSCYSSNNVLSFDKSGHLNFIHGGLPKGDGDNQLNSPAALTIDQDNRTIVSDSLNKRLVILSDFGQVSRIIPLNGEPQCVLLDNNGNILVMTASPWQLLTINYN